MYSIFDIICNEGFVIDQVHRNELKDFIDDTLLWAHVHDKPTKVEYKLKIDEVNEACDKIINEYENNNKDIFSENELIKNSNNPKAELENMVFALKILSDEKKTFLKTNQIKKLNDKIDEIFKLLYETENVSDETYKEKLDEFNIFCQDLYNELEGINFDVNVINSSNIILNDGDSTSGTDIETLLKIRQEEQIRQLLIDSNNQDDNN